MSFRGGVVGLLVVAVLMVEMPESANAAFPGSNGKIAFSSNRDGDFEIWVMNADGSDPEPLTSNTAADQDPAWSPDGTRIAFRSGRDGQNEIYVMNADGSGQTRLTNHTAGDFDPSWSPDGGKIAFTSFRGGDDEGDVYVMNADGSGQTPLTNASIDTRAGAWSPDGTKIAFYPFRSPAGFEIWVMKPDGSDQRSLASTAIRGYGVDWSPDGTKIAFYDDAEEIYTANANGSVVVNITNAPGPLEYNPAWAPDQTRIAFERRGVGGTPWDIWTMNPDGSGQTNLTDGAGTNTNPDWQPAVDGPMIFIHGFAGSQIYCGASEEWPNLPRPRLSKIALGPNGESTPNCPGAGPRAGKIVETALGSDVYGPTVEFLRDEFGSVNLYAWDWRKSPEAAIAGLDALVNRVRAGLEPGDPGGGKVILMAHSMGGLLTRLYVNDAARAAKVARILTVGTPYWGTPKGLLPFVYGVESPGFSAIDVLVANDEMRAFSRFSQGLYFGWPSARYGGWLSIEGREPSPLDRTGLLRLIDERGGNPSLYSTALAAHNLRIDEFASGGTDYQTLIGSGVHTPGFIGIERTPLIERVGNPLNFDERDKVFVEWANGDGTVPLRSGIGSTPAARRHYACGIPHVPLPGDSRVTGRIGGFLKSGNPVIDNVGPSSQLCEPRGLAISSYTLSDGIFARQSVRVRAGRAGASAAKPLTLEAAERAGLIEAINFGRQIEAATSSDDPLTISLRAKGGAAIEVAPLVNGKRGKTNSYVADGSGKINVTLAKGAILKQGGKAVKARRPDNRAPKTRVKVKVRGRTATLTFRVADASPTTTYMKSGKKAARKVKGKRMRLPAAKLRRGVRVLSIDAFGNDEKPKLVKRR
jgi:pimeloyl-ACP methyl ester carboxylesterase